MEITQADIDKCNEINLDEVDFRTGDESKADRRRKDQKMEQVGNLTQKIIDVRMASHEYGLRIIENKIIELQEERSAILNGPVTKEEILKKAKEIIADEKKEALLKYLFMPLREQKESNRLPFSHIGTRTFDDSDIKNIFFISISDEDLEKIVSQLPDTGLSKAERQARIKEINSEIKTLESKLDEELKKARKELEKRHNL